MIYRDGKTIEAIYHTVEKNGSVVVHPIVAIYRGARLVWENVRSNFITNDSLYIQTKDGEIFNVKE